MPDYMYLLESRLTAEQRAVVVRVVELAQSHEANVYLSGGAVRDLVSGMGIRDLDFVVEGNPSRIARELEKGGAHIIEDDEHRRYVELVFHGDVDGSLAAARDEAYAHPGAKPQFHFGTILDDLRRRDFSINAIALSLNAASRGLLLDPANGLADLERREIRILSMHGFTNQPVRLLRALRFAARLSFTLEERTSSWFDLAIERKHHQNIPAADITEEVRQAGKEDNATAVLKSWDEHDLLEVIHPKFVSRKPDYKGLDALMKAREELFAINRRARLTAATLYYTFGRFSKLERNNALKQLGLRAAEVQGVAVLEEQADAAVKLLGSGRLKDPRLAFDALEKLPTETIAFLITYTRQSMVLARIRAYITKWKPLRGALPVAQLEALGVNRGPKFDEVLEKFFTLQIKGRVRKPEDTERILRNLAGIKLDPKKKLKPEKKGKEAPKGAFAGKVAGAVPGQKKGPGATPGQATPAGKPEPAAGGKPGAATKSAPAKIAAPSKAAKAAPPKKKTAVRKSKRKR